VAVPDWPAAGVTVTVRLTPLPPKLIPHTGTSVVFDDPPVIVRLAARAEERRAGNESAPVLEFCGTDWPVTSEMVGGVFGGGGGTVTVRTNVSEAVKPPPSCTVRVMVAVPDWPAAGVTVTVRFAPLPPNEIPLTGTRVVFDDPPVIVRLAA